MSVKRGRGCTLLFSHAGEDKEDVLAAIGLSLADLFDNKQGVDYSYPDGRVVHRLADKQFRQTGHTKGAALYRLDKLPDDESETVYVVEGEKDADTLALEGVATVSAAMGAKNPDKADWMPLAGRPVVVVVDDDSAGREWAGKVSELVTPLASAITFVKAREGKDASDHLTAGHDVTDFVPVDVEPRHRRLTLVWGDQVKTRPVKWWEPELVPLGALTVLAGRGDVGKSTAAVSWVARETTSGNPVMYLHSEDSREATIAPRMIAAGADMTKVAFVNVVHATGGVSDSVTLPDDLGLLEEAITANGITLVVLDALTSFKPADVNANANDDVRRFLEPLQAMADRTGVVLLGIAHFGKADSGDAKRLVLGSTAWTDVPRSVLGFARDEESGDVVVTNVKKNLASRSRSLSYEFDTVPVMTDGGEVSVGVVRWRDKDDTRDVASLLKGDREPGGNLPEPQRWVSSFLRNGPQKAQDVYAVGQSAGHSQRQLRTAHDKLDGERKKQGMDGGWWWRLPGQSWPWDEDDTTDTEDDLSQNECNLRIIPGAFGSLRNDDVIFEGDIDSPEDCEDDISESEGTEDYIECHLRVDDPISYLPVCETADCESGSVRGEVQCAPCLAANNEEAF
ncbi:AAA family ATPase [Gordonia amicalis]|uniref:AAA family ATPase n=1 Tax=Gordonia amicalis TaxID=89053 RepID=UPI0029558E81|nr:AAA family ATPase [Gordonia amicalis]MDV7171921.1 AAA family ATPase [Gordonia amicalis]